MSTLTIGRLASAEGVSIETVRFYQRRGLLDVPDRRGSSYREYTEDDRRRLRFIRRAKGLGFTLAEIGDLLDPAEATSTSEIASAAAAKLQTVEAKVRELTSLACRLRQLLDLCEHGSGADCAALHLTRSTA